MDNQLHYIKHHSASAPWPTTSVDAVANIAATRVRIRAESSARKTLMGEVRCAMEVLSSIHLFPPIGAGLNRGSAHDAKTPSRAP